MITRILALLLSNQLAKSFTGDHKNRWKLDMNDDSPYKDKEIQTLQNRVMELERQLAEAEAAILVLEGSRADKALPAGAQEFEQQQPVAGQVYPGSLEKRLRQAILVIPFPLMIHRDDGSVLTINEAWTKVTGYTLDDIPTVDEWLRRAYPEQAAPAHNDSFSLEDLRWREFQVVSRLGEKRTWDFRTASLGDDSDGRHLLITMAVDITERKQAEQALAESERRQREITRLLELDQARLAAVLQNLPVGIWIADQQGRLIGSNEQADRIWAGETPLLNSTAEYEKFRAWHPESGKPLQVEEYPVAVALRTGQPVEPVELEIQRFDGLKGTVLASAAPIKDRQGLLTGVVSVNVDITERKKTEAALRKSEERFEKAFHATPDAIIISRMSDGLIIEVNEGWRKLFGHDPGEVIGQTSIQLGIYVNPEDRKELIARLEKRGSLHNFELQIRRKSGEIRQASMSVERMEVNGVSCLLTVMRDITERKQAEQALRENEWRLNRAEEIAHLGSWELDLSNNRLTWSDEVYRIFGLQPQEFAATYEAFLEIVHPDDRAAVDASYSASIQASQDSYEIEHRIVKRSSGEVRVVHEKCQHFRDQNGQIVRSVGMVHDITERKHAEEKLKAYAEHQ